MLWAAMSYIIAEGRVPLQGEVCVGGAKNAALPILAATLLTDEEVVLHNVPMIRDVKALLEILAGIGVSISDRGKGSIALKASGVNGAEADPKLPHEKDPKNICPPMTLPQYMQECDDCTECREEDRPYKLHEWHGDHLQECDK